MGEYLSKAHANNATHMMTDELRIGNGNWLTMPGHLGQKQRCNNSPADRTTKIAFSGIAKYQKMHAVLLQIGRQGGKVRPTMRRAAGVLPVPA